MSKLCFFFYGTLKFSVVYFRVAMRIRWVSLFSEALSLVSEDVGGDLTYFL